MNIRFEGSDLSIQLSSEPPYKDFPRRAARRSIFGIDIMTASPEDVLQDKALAFSDPKRRKSKRFKDASDIERLIESKPELEKRLPRSVRDALSSFG